MRNRDSDFCVSDSLPRVRKADGGSDVSDCDGGEEDRRQHVSSNHNHRARKLAKPLLQKEEECSKVFDSAREDRTLDSYQKLVLPVDVEAPPWFSHLPLEVLLDMPTCIRAYHLRHSDGLLVAFDQMSEQDHNQNWDLWNSGIPIRGDAVLLRLGDAVDEHDRDNGWQYVFKNPPIPIKMPAPAPETRRRGLRRKRNVHSR